MVSVGIMSAMTMDLLGLPIQPIVWGLIGGLLGMGFAKKANFFVAAGVYVAASLTSALFGYSTAQAFGWSNTLGNGLSALVSIGFHPLLASFIAKVPEIFNAILGALAKRGQP